MFQPIISGSSGETNTEFVKEGNIEIKDLSLSLSLA